MVHGLFEQPQAMQLGLQIILSYTLFILLIYLQSASPLGECSGAVFIFVQCHAQVQVALHSCSPPLQRPEPKGSQAQDVSRNLVPLQAVQSLLPTVDERGRILILAQGLDQFPLCQGGRFPDTALLAHMQPCR